ncbi:MAG: histone deacetylase [Deltaproteobacteria bacterium]|nr:histone deacetylase [Deltaproteobacteria bacterium]
MAPRPDTGPKTGIVRHEMYRQHLAGYPHVESPERLEVLDAMLDAPDMADRFVMVLPRPANRDELAWIHSESHIDRVAATDGKPHASLDPDTQTTALSYQAARLAAGGLFCLIDKIFDGTVQNGFALVRPPGHHAERDRAMGFCLFNNVALGACYAMKTFGAERVLIVDWDLHHGNATQHSFYDNVDVLYFSTHQYPYYPGSGALTEAGNGKGRGYTVNVPLGPGHGDQEYHQIFTSILKPVSAGFKPDFIFVSAGFDTYKDDPLGAMGMTPTGYAALTRIMMKIAETHCSGKLAFTLEGGYHLAGLRDSVSAVLLELCGQSILSPEDVAGFEAAPVPPIVEEVIAFQKQFWPELCA